ncbi:MAG: DUF1934 domain-containing protein [Clostridia bacterium]|nr:DUF1934 domain-containing protein [Clostridia bacterium]
MKITVKHMSQIERYEGGFSALSTFLLSAKPQVADVERLEEQGTGELTATSPFEVAYRTEEGHPSSICLTENTLFFRRGLSEMRFEKGNVTHFAYRTGYGEWDTEVFTDALSLTEREGKWLLSLSYYARMGDVVQKNTMRFIFTPKNK